MLGKLLKYEFRATARVFLPMYALLAVMSAAARLVYGAQMSRAQGTLLNILTVVVTVAVIGLLAAVGVVTLILICRRFWNNLLGREGYLMNVLPVTGAGHVWAKLIAAAVWSIASAAVSIAALYIMLSRFGESGGLREFLELLRTAGEVLKAYGAAGQARLLAIQLVLFILLSLLSSVLKIYASMAVGQLADKHRIWASVGTYFGIGIAESMVYSRLLVLRALRYTGANMGFGLHVEVNPVELESFEDFCRLLPAVNTEAVWMLGLTLVFCAALFWVTQWLLKKHLNLQ